MHKTALFAVTSSMLFGAVAAQAEPWVKGGVGSDGDGRLSQAELSQVAPALAESFNDMDVDNDQQVSHGEFKSWHESLKVKLAAE